MRRGGCGLLVAASHARCTLSGVRGIAIAVAVAPALCACGGGTASGLRPIPALAPPEPGDAPLAVARYFPLTDGMVYTYATIDEDGQPDSVVARVHRSDETHGDLILLRATKRYTLTPDGVVWASPRGPVYILRAPLRAGATWSGAQGVVRVAEVAAAAYTPSGKYTGCVRTVEEKTGDVPVRYETTYCPDVGIVLILAASGTRHEQAALESHAVPADFRPDGVYVHP
jgi:hypothetical protein